MKEKKFNYSEIFFSPQGEGKYTGIKTAWLRFWGCNLTCQGFGQENPRDPSTWVKEYENLDISKIEKMEDLPILKFGCDSAFSWAKKFKHLAFNKTAGEICNDIEDQLYHPELNPASEFLHYRSKQETHLAFTGGEPMMNQTAMVEIMREFAVRKNAPLNVTVETNGTQMPRENFAEMVSDFYMASENGGIVQDERGATEWFWSVSPKLSASGEPWEKTIKPEVLAEYKKLSDHGQLKYVVDGSPECWAEVEKATHEYRKAGIDWPVYIMAVGSTNEQQRSIQAEICDETILRGYHFSARVHSLIYGNAMAK